MSLEDSGHMIEPVSSLTNPGSILEEGYLHYLVSADGGQGACHESLSLTAGTCNPTLHKLRKESGADS